MAVTASIIALLMESAFVDHLLFSLVATAILIGQVGRIPDEHTSAKHTLDTGIFNLYY
jgi:hypothetical protein